MRLKKIIPNVKSEQKYDASHRFRGGDSSALETVEETDADEGRFSSLPVGISKSEDSSLTLARDRTLFGTRPIPEILASTIAATPTTID
jgi:hypothetical protein